MKYMKAKGGALELGVRRRGRERSGKRIPGLRMGRTLPIDGILQYEYHQLV